MDTKDLIAELSRPTAFPFAAGDVAVRQTHISAVFLAGDVVYKIKKPVRLSFVDFSTLERRRRFCQREVDLNRRLAPDVYLGVVPVARDGGRLRFEGAGDVVEWAVKMRRLPESGTLADHVRREAVDPGLMRNLGERIADYHRAAESNEQVQRFATFDAVAANIEDNLSAATQAAGNTISPRVALRLTDLARAELQRCRSLIDARAARGVPRDTHGDLRLEHVYVRSEVPPPGDWVIIDCIEFNDGLRFADPVADIAFLVMDLKSFGRRDLARRLSEAYLAAAHDADGIQLLPLYTSYRAAVRAKVETIEIGEREVPETERAAAADRARGHWLLALAELSPPDQTPCVVLVGGLPGAGKSTVARRVAQVAGFRIIRSDEVRKELAGLDKHESARTALDTGIYSPAWTDDTYAECLRQCERLLFEGGRVLIDATFTRERHRQLFLDAAQHWGVPAVCLLCECDAEIARRRLMERTGDVSDADWDVYLDAAAQWEALTPTTARAVRRVDTATSESAAAAQAMAALAEHQLVSQVR